MHQNIDNFQSKWWGCSINESSNYIACHMSCSTHFYLGIFKSWIFFFQRTRFFDSIEKVACTPFFTIQCSLVDLICFIAIKQNKTKQQSKVNSLLLGGCYSCTAKLIHIHEEWNETSYQLLTTYLSPPVNNLKQNPLMST